MQVGLVVVKNVLWRDTGHNLLKVVKKPVDIIVGDSCPAALDQRHCPYGQLRVPFQETSDEVGSRQVVNKPSVFLNCTKFILKLKFIRQLGRGYPNRF